MESKREIRKRILELRDNMDQADREYMNGRLYKRVVSCKEIISADVIMAYVSYKSEVDTIPIINKLLLEGKKIVVPRVSDDDMDFYVISDLNNLEEGYKGIKEPASDCIKYEPAGNEIMLLPGTVFDKRLFRVGYGKGYYDRYLARHKGITTIGLAYDFQLVDEVPVDTWDKGLDMIITEKNTYLY